MPIVKSISAIPESLTGFSEDELEGLLRVMGEPGYRARQVRQWIYHGLAESFNEMSDLPLALRERLAKEARLHSLTNMREVTGKDSTVKTAFRLAGGNVVEASLMSYRRDSGAPRYTACISTQVGCAIGCPFCATGQQGFERNLTTGEIVDQVLHFARCLRKVTGENERSPTGRSLSNIVFMGMGEPLANYDAVWKAIEILNSPGGFGLGARNLTISTAGLVPQIKRLAGEKLQVGLAVSLHASENRLRNRLVPINRKYPLEELIPACREYSRVSGRRPSFEYVLFRGINDSLAQARSLAELLRGMTCHVNLIPANATGDASFRPPPRESIVAFALELKRLGINATVRQARGQDIDAGCGQLRRRIPAGEKTRHRQDKMMGE
ncbi:MAG: 23S rRNA (adenine(2503)-C(2))-methyltransferase [Chloroflexi bacterium RBG_16_56_11]|nr:MAG: 23S rRNA (adenine(2503)-C(2))-methyltransferase [Chloroflexi bacterium RBG_16_56_11]